MTMIDNFLLVHYRFTLLPAAVITMPAFNKGNVLRGAFGSSLRRLVCVMERDTRCLACLLKEKCAYALIFDPVGISPVKRLQNAPRGYVLKPPLERETEYTSDRPFSFDMILIGDRRHYLPYVIVALTELGKAGIGLNRGKFSLDGISVIENSVPVPAYDPLSNTVKSVETAVKGSDLTAAAKGLKNNMMALHFFTPTRIKYNPTGEKGESQVVRVPEFHHIIRRLRDRINALSVTYCGGPIDADFRGMAERATGVKTKEISLRWIEIKRKSRTQPVEHDQSGFIGKIAFEGDLTEFLPLLLLGEFVHVGEDAVFGNGWYRVQRTL